MQMRVIECDECGETLQAANDEELARVLGRHLTDEHEMEVDEEELTELVEAEAYEAMDS
jgi:predicted small metal-binding protein